MARPSGNQALMSLFSDFHLVDLLIRRELEAHGVNVMWLAPLDLIATRGEITPTEIVSEMGLPPTTVRRAVNDLVERGEVRYANQQAEKRVRRLVRPGVWATVIRGA